MKEKIKKIIIGLVLTVIVMAPALAQADWVFCGKKLPAGMPASSATTAPYKPCEVSDLFVLLYYIVNFFVSVAGLVAVFFIFWGAIKMVLARGNPTAFGNAKDTIIRAIGGFILIMLSYLIIDYVASLIVPGGTGGLNYLKGFLPK